MSSRRTRVLLIGPLPRAGGSIGGTQVSFAELVRGLESRGKLALDVLDTSRDAPHAGGWRRALDGVALFARVLQEARARIGECDVVMFNASSGAMLRAGPCFAALARLYGKPFVARCFGGNLDEAVAGASRVEAALALRMLGRAELVLLQTHALCERFSAIARVQWLPTTRTPQPGVRRRDSAARKFLFVAQMRREKGFGEALAAIERAPEGCTLTLAGPDLPGTDVAELANSPRARWLGPQEPAQIAQLFAEHDAFVFPSWYAGEGLPGAVVEALQAGLPVIAAEWRSIRELVEDGENGLVVPIRDAPALAAAMTRLATDAQLVRRLSKGALRAGEAFRAEPVLARLENCLDSLARGAVPARPLLEVAE